MSMKPEENGSEEITLPESGAGTTHNLVNPNAYRGSSELVLKEGEKEALAAPIDPEDLDILPTKDGEVYPSQVVIRRRLNEVFGPGAWAMEARGNFQMVDVTHDDRGEINGGRLVREYALFVRGCFIGEALGGHDYIPTNRRQDYDTACESVKSSALKRLAKDLGIASECWDKRRMQEWKQNHAVCVKVKGRDGKLYDQWRRKDATALPYEQAGSESNPAMNPQRRSEAQAPAPQAQAAPAKQTRMKDGDKGTVQGLIEEIVERATSNGVKRYGLKIKNRMYGTFNETIAEEARWAAVNKAEVMIEYTFNEQYQTSNIESITVLDQSQAQPAQAGAASEESLPY